LHIGYGYVLEDPGFDSGQEQNILIFSEPPDGVGDQPWLVCSGYRVLSWEVNRPGTKLITHRIYCQV